MEASLLADEHFDVAVSALLRRKGHNVISVRSLNVAKTGDGWTDRNVLEEGIRLRRIILTDNIKDFRREARDVPWHEGIVGCSPEDDASAKADRIDLLLREKMRELNNERLTGQWIDAKPRSSITQ